MTPGTLGNHAPHETTSLVAAQKAYIDSSRRRPRALKRAFSQASTLPAHDSSGSLAEEDYDHLELDPYAVVPGAHGGGFRENPSKPRLRFPKSRLSRDAQNGDYVLEARDADVQEIISDGVGLAS